ncbi:MAG: SMC-Scp complex subunit ScpB [Firmicutes bacterium]|nr:SMC-Scp complex subunit ScpB [Bacillota bacterium]
MEQNGLRAAVEAMIFAGGDPVSCERMAGVLGVSMDMIDSLCSELNEYYDESGSALRVVKLGKQYQLSTRDEYAGMIRTLLDLKKDVPLSNAAMEVLAVIAYNEPVTRNFVERVRGVDCSGVVNTLLARGLIEEKGRLDLPGRPMQYATSPNFLRCFGLESIGELPTVPSETAENAQISVEEAIEENLRLDRGNGEE